jgi:ABC-type nitrate/sulfonate/bicarbonate transport system permease component
MSFRNKFDVFVEDRTDVSLLERVGSLVGPRAVGLGVGYLAWSLLALYFPRELLPTPLETALLSWNLIVTGTAWTDLAATFESLFWGFLLAMLLGTSIGIATGINNYSRDFFTPYINIGLSIPGIAWAATTFLVFTYVSFAFGTLRAAPVAAVALTTFPYIGINIWKGVENIDHELIDMARAFDVSRRTILWRSIIPNIAPQIFSAARFGLAISWKVTILAEIFASSAGVGFKLMHAYQVYKYEETWAWAALFLTIIMLIEYGIFRPLERRVFEYRSDVELSDIGGMND